MADSEYTARERNIHMDLKELSCQLEIVQSGIVVASAALRHQQAEGDVDIATVLEHDVARRLWAQIDHIQGLIDLLQDPAFAPPQPRPGNQERVPMQ